MRAPVLAAIVILAVSCSTSGQPTAAGSPHASASQVGVSPTAGRPSPAASSSAIPVQSAGNQPPGNQPSPPPTPLPCTRTGSFGLLIAAGNLDVDDVCGKIAATAPIAASSVQLCSPGGIKANLEPPVSASNDVIYFRDGDTKIRSLPPSGPPVDVTTVPGSATTVSFFSVSPDDQRIVVMVEDFSSATAVGLRLYVEDLKGGGHHSDIYTATVDRTGTTLWPMGWHNGDLVLALIAVCSDTPVSPAEWHVVDPVTPRRVATITAVCPPGNQSGVLSRWPSPAGVGCSDFAFRTAVIDWTGSTVAVASRGVNANDVVSGISPSGKMIFVGSATATGECGGSAKATCIDTIPAEMVTVQAVDELACLWIDDSHLLTPDAVLTVPPLPQPFTPARAGVVSLPASGECAGRFPGGL